MTTYYDAKGQKIQVYLTDPNPVAEGQVWYNATSQKLKTQLSFTEAWSTGGNMNIGRQFAGGDGLQTAAIAMAGYGNRPDSPGVDYSAATELYNGTAWTTATALSIARTELAGAGIQTAAVAFGGGAGPAVSPVAYLGIKATEEFDGSSWTAGGDMGNPGRAEHSGCGTQTAALAISGTGPPPNNVNNPDGILNTEEYNGTSWTAGGSLTVRKALGAGVGIQTAALAWGGNYPPAINMSEEYDGSSWTAAPNLVNAIQRHSGAGTQTAALSFGGGQPAGNLTEKYDGTSWTSTTPMITARRHLMGAGTQAAGLAFGGFDGSQPPELQYTTATEEWNTGPFLAPGQVGQ